MPDARARLREVFVFPPDAGESSQPSRNLDLPYESDKYMD